MSPSGKAQGDQQRWLSYILYVSVTLNLWVQQKGSLQHASFPGIIPFGDREQKVTKLAVNYSVSSLVL